MSKAKRKRPQRYRLVIHETQYPFPGPMTDEQVEKDSLWSRSIGIYTKVDQAMSAATAILADKYEEVLQSKMNDKEWRDAVKMPKYISQILQPDGKIRIEDRTNGITQTLLANWIANDKSHIKRLITFRLIDVD